MRKTNARRKSKRSVSNEQLTSQFVDELASTHDCKCDFDREDANAGVVVRVGRQEPIE